MNPVIIIAIAFVLLIPSTVFAELSIGSDGGDCSKIGIWDSDSKTCTMNKNVNEEIDITGNWITLNGNGFSINGTSVYRSDGEGNFCVFLDAKIGVTLTNLKILGGCARGIYLVDSLENTISNSQISSWNNQGGIILHSSNNNEILNNVVTGTGVSVTGNNNKIENNKLVGRGNVEHGSTGISISGSNNIVKDNEISNFQRSNKQLEFGAGISINGETSLTSGKNNLIINNIIKENNYGIKLQNAIENIIESNDILFNKFTGILLGDTTYPVNTNDFVKNQISNNKIGIEMGGRGAVNNVFIENTISSNSEIGIKLGRDSPNTVRTQNNVFLSNNFIDNSRQASFAQGNIFYDKIGGNYWSDYSSGCENSNSDSFCDEAYPFSSGSVGVVDNAVWIEKDGWKTSNIEKITPEPETSSQIDPPSLQLDAEPSDQSIKKIQEYETKKQAIASFVDKTKDPQSYIDRYNKEPSYKKWFHDNYPQYDSIEQAVGLELTAKIPDWIKNVFLWYGQDQISEDELLDAIKYLIDKGILMVN